MILIFSVKLSDNSEIAVWGLQSHSQFLGFKHLFNTASVGRDNVLLST